MRILFSSILAISTLCSYAVMAEATIIKAHPSVSEEIIQQAQFHARQLGLAQNVYIAISFSQNIPSGFSGYTRYRNIESLNGGHQVRIVISSDMSRHRQKRVLAHEMVHAKQFVEGKLVKCRDRHYSWSEGMCLDIKRISYYNRPWEKEAYKLGNRWYQAYKKRTAVPVNALTARQTNTE